MITEVDTWSGVASSNQPSWEYRSEIIAKLIRATDTVFDFGAGNRKLSRFIPKTCSYVPIDCTDEIPGTFLVDFNVEFKIPEATFDVAVCAGFLEYLDDLPGFFRSLAQKAAGRQIIFTYLFSDETHRLEMKTHNAYRDVNELLSAIGNSVSHVDIFAHDRDTTYFSATLSENAGSTSINRRVISDLFEKNAEPNRGLRRFVSNLMKRLKSEKAAV